MFDRKKKSKKTRLPISLEDLIPKKDVRGSGQKQLFGILASDSEKKRKPNSNN